MRVESILRLGVVFVFLAGQAVAEDLSASPFSITMFGEVRPKADLSSGLSSMERLGFLEDSEHFDLHMVLEANNDRQFGSDTIFLKNTNDIGNYFLIDQGFVRLKALGFQFQGGRFLPEDEVKSPYSLFLNSEANSLNPESNARTSMLIKYEKGPFLYSSQWISLNYRSDFGSVSNAPKAWAKAGMDGFPDRGTNIHNFAVRFGEWRVGFQDQATYSQRNFDSEYFLSPMPQYFTQYLRNVEGRPWTTGGTDKYQMGLFAEWKQADKDAYIQLQMADFNLHFLNPSIFPNNPGKYAWSLGGHVTNDWGRWGLFHAGATKFMYEPLTMGSGDQAVRDFNNSYYPDTVYMQNGNAVPIDLETNQIGYIYGENNVALLATWDRRFLNETLLLGASLEFVLAGNNSPANPWQDAAGQDEMGTQLLSDPVLSKTIKSKFRAQLDQGPLSYSVDLLVGQTFNVLELRDPSNTQTNWSYVDQYVQIWKPSSNNRTLLTLVFGLKYTYDAAPLIDWLNKENGVKD